MNVRTSYDNTKNTTFCNHQPLFRLSYRVLHQTRCAEGRQLKEARLRKNEKIWTRILANKNGTLLQYLSILLPGTENQRRKRGSSSEGLLRDRNNLFLRSTYMYIHTLTVVLITLQRAWHIATTL
ncbi:hypothetical protein BDBG_03066 [Blastomyces gilchristii SLH14081]|uniref:Uncharacterized protein n=1 Tax=Blastomyces gilchristii (strain SLH14081) TaxID=559298 RepID=A0A179UFW8_BLAGS|nr:uncharacterized protein BDBG_03066 [Blastomyces gilchristii SLH14081]OAT06936.1 hypothetical protein BDBG_03066 [Blastomyces gilchristii SLH14081]